jgi:hypothetical protein
LSLVVVLAAIGVVLGFLKAKGTRPADKGRQTQPAARPSYLYTGVPADLVSLDGDTLVQTHIGTGKAVAVDPMNNQLWCPTLISNAVIVRDGISGAVVTNLTLADCPTGAAFDAIHRVVWITAQCGLSSNTNYPSNDLLWAIDANTYVVIAGPIYCGGVNGAPEIVNPVTGRFYHNVKGTQRLDPRNFIPATMPYGTVRAAHPTANLLYAIGNSNLLQILDGGPDPEAVLTNVSLPFAASGICVGVNPRLNQILVGNLASNEIVRMDARTGKIEQTITLHGGGVKVMGVQGIDVDPVRNRVFALAIGVDQHYYLFAIEDAEQRSAALPGSVAGPVVNPAINKVYVWIEYQPE